MQTLCGDKNPRRKITSGVFNWPPFGSRGLSKEPLGHAGKRAAGQDGKKMLNSYLKHSWRTHLTFACKNGQICHLMLKWFDSSFDHLSWMHILDFYINPTVSWIGHAFSDFEIIQDKFSSWCLSVSYRCFENSVFRALIWEKLKSELAHPPSCKVSFNWP